MVLQNIIYHIVSFTCPIYTQSSTTLSLTNAMPPSSTNIIDDDNISTSTISELDLDQFTYFSDGNILSNSTLNTLGVISS